MKLSIRWRLAGSCAVVLLGCILTFYAGIFSQVRRSLIDQVEQSLSQDTRAVAAVADDSKELAELEENGIVGCFKVEADGRPAYRSRAWIQAGLDGIAADPDGVRTMTSVSGRAYRVEDRMGHGGRRTVRVARDVDGVEQSLNSFHMTLMLSLPLALALAVGAGYYLAGRVLLPVTAMTARLEAIHADRLGERVPVENPGDEFGRLATVLNQALQRLEDSFLQLRRFTADASHELRTPLTALRTVGEVGLSRPLEAGQAHEIIGSMLEEVGRLGRLVDDLLFLTRSDAGTILLHPEPQPLAGMADDVVKLLRVLADEKGQIIETYLDPEVGAVVDAPSVRQALINVVDNAIRYTPEAGRIDIRVQPGPAGQACIEVRDSGPGIPVAHLPHVFDRFYRIDVDRNRASGGSGLGLAIAQQAIVANGGSIAVESAPGRGSTFRIILPSAS